MKFEPAQIIRKSTQANASHRKSSQVSGQTRHKSTQVKTCDDLRSRLIRPLEKVSYVEVRERPEIGEDKIFKFVFTILTRTPLPVAGCVR